MAVPELKTRRPSGKPPWPMLCIAGVEKSGKSYAACDFSKSDLIDRTFYIELGEGAADQYGEIPGTRYEIVEHDGTFNSILGQAQAAVAAPVDSRPHAIVVDSLTELWDLLSDEAQAKANRRAAMKAAEKKRPAPAEDVQITMDLWNEAKKKWRRFLDVLRVHDGPVILLARLELVVVMEGGKPSEAREWKIRAEKNLPYECDAIVKMYAPQSAFLTGVRSTRLQVPPGKELPQPQFTIDGLLRALGLDQTGATAPRSYTAPRVDLDDDAPMTRQPPRANDEWNTTTGQPLPPPGPAMPSPTVDEINEMVQLLGVKRHVFNGHCAGVVSKMVRRPIGDPSELSQAEIRTVIETLTAEDDWTPPAAPPGTPNNPVINQADHRQMQALFKEAGIVDRDGQHAFIQRVLRLDKPLESRNHITKDQFKKIRHALSTGEVPPAPEPPGPDAMGEGISEYDALHQLVLDAHTPEEFEQARADIEREHAEGGITGDQLAALQAHWVDTRNERQAMAGAAS